MAVVFVVTPIVVVSESMTGGGGVHTSALYVADLVISNDGGDQHKVAWRGQNLMHVIFDFAVTSGQGVKTPHPQWAKGYSCPLSRMSSGRSRRRCKLCCSRRRTSLSSPVRITLNATTSADSTNFSRNLIM